MTLGLGLATAGAVLLTTGSATQAEPVDAATGLPVTFTTGGIGVPQSGPPDTAVTPTPQQEAPLVPPAEVEAAPVAPVADGRLKIASVGFSEPVVSEIHIGPEGGTIRPEGRGLAQAHIDGFEAGQLYVIHSGGERTSPGNLLVERDAVAPTVAVGAEVTLPDGGVGVVTRAEISPKDSIPEWVWTSLADGGVVIATCKPETDSPERSSSNALILIERQ